ncbi:hypothetical protein [Microbacterium sp. TPU 3598]|uniref:hypothetical protein n=1 Tax=Microbacterium sp. TPU 3598 TaxID=1938334 RepID=UPI0012FD1AD3|nr:hypothetical protein [Microbacterium sp. TPU 3598]
MSTFSNSRSSAIAVTLKGDFSLDQLREVFAQNPPDHDTLTGGWASTDDTASNINARNVAPPRSEPEILPADGAYPSRLAARYYFFKSNKQLRESFPNSPQEHHYIAAFDVLISATGAGDHMALLSSRSAVAAGKLIKALREVMLSIDPNAKIIFDGSQIAFSADLFFWLIVRSRNEPVLDGHLTIDAVLRVNGQDNANRATTLSDGVDFNRPALLVAVAEIDQLGPVRVVLRASDLEAKVTVDVWSGGVFSVLKGETHYTDEIDSPELRVTSIEDFAYDLLPRIIRAYATDDAWDDSRREEEILAAAQTIVDRYLRRYPQLGQHPPTS